MRTAASGRSRTRRSSVTRAYFPATRVLIALHRRRRGAEHDERALPARAQDRDVPAVIARRLLLLVRAVVLLVDDHQASRSMRREDGRPRARPRHRPRRGGCDAIDRDARRPRARCAEWRRGRRRCRGRARPSTASARSPAPATGPVRRRDRPDRPVADRSPSSRCRSRHAAARPETRAHQRAPTARRMRALLLVSSRPASGATSASAARSNGSRSSRSSRNRTRPRFTRPASTSARDAALAQLGGGQCLRARREDIEAGSLLSRQTGASRPSQVVESVPRQRSDPVDGGRRDSSLLERRVARARAPRRHRHGRGHPQCPRRSTPRPIDTDRRSPAAASGSSSSVSARFFASVPLRSRPRRARTTHPVSVRVPTGTRTRAPTAASAIRRERGR